MIKKSDKILEKELQIEKVEEFMRTDYYHEFFGRLLDSLIEKYTTFALGTEDPKDHQCNYSPVMIYSRIRKELMAIKQNPLRRLNELKLSVAALENSQ